MLTIKSLGGLTISKNGHAMRDLGSHKAEAILVYLATLPGLHSRNVLAALLWPDNSDTQALTSLRVALSQLRKDLGDYLEIFRDTVGIKPGPSVYFDVADLEAKLISGLVEQALELYQGDFLQGFYIHDSLEFEDWQRMQQERIHNMLTNALHSTISDAVASEDYTKGQHLAQRLVELNPLDERAHRELILLLALSGQRVSAMAQYEKCKAVLRAEFGIEPSIEVQELYDQISSRARPTYSRVVFPANFQPVPQTSFIDRVQELNQITNLIASSNCRLLTLVGPGGVGKTRLALRAATRCLQSFSDGVYLVSLEDVVSPDYLFTAIADAIHFKIDYFVSQLESKSQLFNYLKNRSILLLLDGFEHLAASAGLLAEALNQVPHLKLLVTSRQKLELSSEWVFTVTGFPVPEISDGALAGDSAALLLFEERARQAGTDFQLSSINQRYAVDICRCVEGVPLGIELAAAWTSVLSPLEIAQEIQKSLDFLVSSAQDVLEKHRSLRTAFNSSWKLLDEGQRAAFRKLSVFQGGFGWLAALRVTGVSLDQLSSLLTRSMIRRDGAGRYYLHGLLRQYGLEALNSSATMRDEVYNKHCEYYCGYLLQRESDLTGSKMYIARDEVRQEMENVRMAVNWAVVHWVGEKVQKILTVLLSFYVVHGWQEGKDVFRDIAQLRKDELLSQDMLVWASDPVYLCARIHQAILLCNLGAIDESDSISRECLEPLKEAGMPAELSECLQNLGTNASFRGEYEYARKCLEEAILIGKESQIFIWPTYLLWLGHTCFLLGEYRRGMDSFQKCYELFDRRGNLWGKAFALSKMGLAADGLGEFLESMQYHREAFSIFEKTQNEAGKAYAISRMSMSAYFLEDYSQAIQYGLDGYKMYQTLGHEWGICTSLCRLGFAYVGMGEIARAKDCFTDALEQSRMHQMIPVSMYALVGMAAALAKEGEEETARKLFNYARSNPQTPSLYLQQASRWIPQLGSEVLLNTKSALVMGGEADGLEEIIDVVNKAWGRHAL